MDTTASTALQIAADYGFGIYALFTVIGAAGFVLFISIAFVWRELRKHEKHCNERHDIIDTRLGNLEKDVAVLKTDVGNIKEDIKEIKDNLNRMNERFDRFLELMMEKKDS